MPYTVIDHTADTGVRVWAPDLPSLFAEAARAMFEQITETRRLEANEVVSVAVDGIDRTDLLINWLRELLFLFAGKGLLIKDVRIDAFDDRHVAGQAAGEPYDRQKHDIDTEIKAVTYYGADVKAVTEEWTATIIFDI